jgi:hypothetical protein
MLVRRSLILKGGMWVLGWLVAFVRQLKNAAPSLFWRKPPDTAIQTSFGNAKMSSRAVAPA